MAKKNERTSAQHETTGTVLRRLMYGQMVSGDFFARNWLVLLVGVFMMIAYISGKYTCKTKMEEVQRLEHQLEVVNAERVRARSQYMGRIRESAMRGLVDSLHLNLLVQELPPYTLEVE